MAEPTVQSKTNPVTRDRFDAVLFDLDGVLTSTAAIHADAWKSMFDAFLLPRGERAFDIDGDYKKYVDGRPRYEGVKTFLESRNIHLPLGEASEAPNDHTLTLEMPRRMDLNSVFSALSAAGVRVRSMRTQSNRLEELFVRLTGDNNKTPQAAATEATP